MKFTPFSVGGVRLRVSRLAWHLTWILALKFVLLTVLWHVFIKPERVRIDAQAMEARLTRPSQVSSMESSHDRSLSR